MPRETIDFIILVIFAIGFILGFRDGFLKKLLSIIGFVIAIIGAFQFSPKLRSFLLNLYDFNPATAVILSFIIIFLVIILLTKILINILKPRSSVTGFIDRILGAFLGAFQIGLFLSGVLIVLNFFSFPNQKEKNNLKYYNFTYNLLPNTFSFVKVIIPDSKVIFDIIKDVKKEVKLNNGRNNR